MRIGKIASSKWNNAQWCMAFDFHHCLSFELITSFREHFFIRSFPFSIRFSNSIFVCFYFVIFYVVVAVDAVGEYPNCEWMDREWRCWASFAHKIDTISFSLFASYAQEIYTVCVSAWTSVRFVCFIATTIALEFPLRCWCRLVHNRLKSYLAKGKNTVAASVSVSVCSKQKTYRS